MSRPTSVASGSAEHGGTPAASAASAAGTPNGSRPDTPEAAAGAGTALTPAGGSVRGDGDGSEGPPDAAIDAGNDVAGGEDGGGRPTLLAPRASSDGAEVGHGDVPLGPDGEPLTKQQRAALADKQAKEVARAEQLARELEELKDWNPIVDEDPVDPQLEGCPDVRGIHGACWSLVRAASRFVPHIDCVQRLLDAGGDVEEVESGDRGARPLMLAAELNHTEVCELLLDAGASVDATDHDGATAIIYAATEDDAGERKKEEDRAKLAAVAEDEGEGGGEGDAGDEGAGEAQGNGDAGAVSAADGDAATSGGAVGEGSDGDKAAKPGGDSLPKNDAERTEKEQSVPSSPRVITPGSTVGKEPSPTSDGDLGKTPIAGAATTDDDEGGASKSPRSTGAWSKSSFTRRRSEIRRGCAALLIDAGANVNARGKFGITALHVAAEGGQAALVQLLLEADADPSLARYDDGTTAMHAACALGHAGTVRLMMRFGADVNARDLRGQTPLFYAAAYSHADCVDAIAENAATNGVDVNAFDHNGRTVVYVAVECGANRPTMDALIRAGVDVMVATTELRLTPLHLAAYNGLYSTINQLLDAGADVWAQDKSRAMPVHYAIAVDNRECMQLLLAETPEIRDRIRMLNRCLFYIETGTVPHKALEKLLRAQRQEAIDADLAEKKAVEDWAIKAAEMLSTPHQTAGGHEGEDADKADKKRRKHRKRKKRKKHKDGAEGEAATTPAKGGAATANVVRTPGSVNADGDDDAKSVAAQSVGGSIAGYSISGKSLNEGHGGDFFFGMKIGEALMAPSAESGASGKSGDGAGGSGSGSGGDSGSESDDDEGADKEGDAGNKKQGADGDEAKQVLVEGDGTPDSVRGDADGGDSDAGGGSIFKATNSVSGSQAQGSATGTDAGQSGTGSGTGSFTTATGTVDWGKAAPPHATPAAVPVLGGVGGVGGATAPPPRKPKHAALISGSAGELTGSSSIVSGTTMTDRTDETGASGEGGSASGGDGSVVSVSSSAKLSPFKRLQRKVQRAVESLDAETLNNKMTSMEKWVARARLRAEDAIDDVKLLLQGKRRDEVSPLRQGAAGDDDSSSDSSGSDDEKESFRVDTDDYMAMMMGAGLSSHGSEGGGDDGDTQLWEDRDDMDAEGIAKMVMAKRQAAQKKLRERNARKKDKDAAQAAIKKADAKGGTQPRDKTRSPGAVRSRPADASPAAGSRTGRIISELSHGGDSDDEGAGNGGDPDGGGGDADGGGDEDDDDDDDDDADDDDDDDESDEGSDVDDDEGGDGDDATAS